MRWVDLDFRINDGIHVSFNKYYCSYDIFPRCEYSNYIAEHTIRLGWLNYYFVVTIQKFKSSWKL
jgi:hypothetical protein